METYWASLFDNAGSKTVSKNDRKKNAYLPNIEQQYVLGAAGFTPGTDADETILELTVLCDPSRTSVVTSYYAALRGQDAARRPEIRMGRDLISRWLEPHDQLLIGNIGSQLFALKLGNAPTAEEEMVMHLGRGANLSSLTALAGSAVGPPPTRTVSREEFVRNRFVVYGALARAGGRCEFPNCERGLFLRDDGTPYLEVHHIEPFSEGGADTLANAAAICPSCHRELHHGADRTARRSAIRDAVGKKGLA